MYACVCVYVYIDSVCVRVCVCVGAYLHMCVDNIRIMEYLSLSNAISNTPQ